MYPCMHARTHHHSATSMLSRCLTSGAQAEGNARQGRAARGQGSKRGRVRDITVFSAGSSRSALSERMLAAAPGCGQQMRRNREKRWAVSCLRNRALGWLGNQSEAEQGATSASACTSALSTHAEYRTAMHHRARQCAPQAPAAPKRQLLPGTQLCNVAVTGACATHRRLGGRASSSQTGSSVTR